MDEVFGSDNFIAEIIYVKTGGLSSNYLASRYDFIIWYGKDKNITKYRQLYNEKSIESGTAKTYNWVELPDGTRRSLKKNEKFNTNLLPKGSKIYKPSNVSSQGNPRFEFSHSGVSYTTSWKTNYEGVKNLAKSNRLHVAKNSLQYVRYLDDFPVVEINQLWSDTATGNFTDDKIFVVQSGTKAISRCILMTTDPGDLVLDPTCGSGTSAYVAEQWGRRWITIDTSRIALNIAKTRLMTATYPFYHLYSDSEVEATTKDNKIKKIVTTKPLSHQTGDIRQGFVYEEVSHITLKSLANDEPPATETLYDKPMEDKSKLRVSGPFTVETLQNFEPVSPESIDDGRVQEEDTGIFEERIFAHLKSAGIKNGIRNEQAVFIRIEQLADTFLHAEGFYKSQDKERKAYFHIGPKFGTVSKIAVNEAVKACRQRGDADWLVILGFSFESAISNENITTSLGSFEVTKVRMNDDLMQDGLLKKDKKAASFVTIGEPDIELHTEGNEAFVEICGLDIYDPIRDSIKARDVEDIAYWMVDSDYDGSNFVIRQVFFCGGSKGEFKKWQKGLSDLSKRKIKIEAEKTLKIEIDDEAFDSLYGFKSIKFEYKSNQKVAVRVISQFGEESTKVM